MLEKRLRERYALKVERFAHHDLELALILPRAADELIDEAKFRHDERLPYWAELWPSAMVLARSVLDEPTEGRTLELGCGLGLPSLALAAAGADVLATDYFPEALEFVAANAERNGIRPPRTRLLDWRDVPADLGSFDRVIASDVLYERRNVPALTGLLARVTAAAGLVRIADPGRMYQPEFIDTMRRSGWTRARETIREEPVPGADRVSRIVLTDFVREERDPEL